MAKVAVALLLGLFVQQGALAAPPEATYLAARDKSLAEVKRLEQSKAADSAIQAAQDKAMADLASRLKEIIGPVSVKGFPAEGKLNLDTLSENDEGFAMLDGLRFGDDQRLVVTTRALLAAWLNGKAKEKDQGLRLPAEIDNAVRLEGFYTTAISPDAAFSKNADLPVTKPQGADLAFAALGEFQQDIGHDHVDDMVATLVKGDRVLVASVHRKAPIGQIATCEAIWTEAQRKAKELQEAGYRASAQKMKEKLGDESEKTEDQGDKDYRACFNAHAPKEAFFPGLAKEAQDLVDRLAGE